MDSDGDLDLLIGTYSNGIDYVKNVGTRSVPVYEEQTGYDNPLWEATRQILGFNARIANGDIDGDGNQDVVVRGGNTGQNYYVYLNRTGVFHHVQTIDAGFESISPDIIETEDYPGWTLIVDEKGTDSIYQLTPIRLCPRMPYLKPVRSAGVLTDCVICPAATPRWDGSECVACLADKHYDWVTNTCVYYLSLIHI